MGGTPSLDHRHRAVQSARMPPSCKPQGIAEEPSPAVSAAAITAAVPASNHGDAPAAACHACTDSPDAITARCGLFDRPAAAPEPRWPLRVSRWAALFRFVSPTRPGPRAWPSPFFAFPSASPLEPAMRSQPSRSTEPLPGGNPSRPLSRRLALLGAWLIALVGLAGPAMAAEFYVATTGNDSNDCQSAGSACRTIQAAIDKAGVKEGLNKSPALAPHHFQPGWATMTA